MIEHLAAIPVEVDYSSEFRYRRPPIDDRTMIIAVSQSGETADTIAAMEEGRARGAHLLAITNTVDSSIARKADAQLYTRCGPETSVTTTKCFSHAARGLLSVRDPSGSADGTYFRVRFPHFVGACVGDSRTDQINLRERAEYSADRAQIRAGARLPVPRTRYQLPDRARRRTQAEGNSYIHAEGYSAGEMKHGPIALIDDKMPVVVIIPNDDLFEKSMSNLKEVESRNGRIIAVTNHATAELKSVAAEIIEVPETNGC